jgi:hypothetical protein
MSPQPIETNDNDPMNDLDKLTKQLVALASDLTASGKAKTFVQQADDLKKSLKAAKEVNWEKLIPLIEEALGGAKADADRQLGERRQKMLETVKAKCIHYRSESDMDTVDVFKVRYRGATTIIEFAGVEVGSLDELDGEKLANAILLLRGRLEKAGLDRSSFFRFVKTAIEHSNAKNPSRDGYVDLGVIYRELLFEHAWSKSSFAKSGSPKHFPEYPFYQFLWDLAAFIGGGNREGDFRLSGRTPAMSERTNSYKLPNLGNPQAPGEVTHMLRVQPTQE